MLGFKFMAFKNTNARYCLLLLLSLPLLLSCSRNAGEVSKIKLDFGSNTQSMSSTFATTFQPGIFIINVRGPGISYPILTQWENPCWHDGVTNCSVVPPTYLEVDVPSGSDRLIQVLSVYFDENDSMKYYYGDTVASLSGGDVSVSIPIVQVGAGSADSRIVGRYLNLLGNGPTGPVHVRYQPLDTNRPAMTISDRENIIAGWLDIFAVDGADLTYVFAPTGEQLFTAKVEGSNFYINGSLISNTNPNLMTIDIPAHYTYYYDTVLAQNVFHESSAKKVLYGFFGPGAGSKAACRIVDSTLTGTSKTTGSVSTMSWKNSGSCVAGDICATGGLPFGDSLCSSTLYEDYLMPFGSLFGQGTERALGIQSSFKAFFDGTYYRYTTTTRAVNTLTISWQYLPGTHPNLNTASSLTGVDVFYKHGTTQYSNTPSCLKLIDAGYSYLTTSLTDTATGSLTSSLGGLVAICPYKTTVNGKIYVDKAVLDSFSDL